jgi:DnaJ-class molecular chaperone
MRNIRGDSRVVKSLRCSLCHGVGALRIEEGYDCDVICGQCRGRGSVANPFVAWKVRLEKEQSSDRCQ